MKDSPTCAEIIERERADHARTEAMLKSGPGADQLRAAHRQIEQADELAAAGAAVNDI